MRNSLTPSDDMGKRDEIKREWIFSCIHWVFFLKVNMLQLRTVYILYGIYIYFLSIYLFLLLHFLKLVFNLVIERWMNVMNFICVCDFCALHVYFFFFQMCSYIYIIYNCLSKLNKLHFFFIQMSMFIFFSQVVSNSKFV